MCLKLLFYLNTKILKSTSFCHSGVDVCYVYVCYGFVRTQQGCGAKNCDACVTLFSILSKAASGVDFKVHFALRAVINHQCKLKFTKD